MLVNEHLTWRRKWSRQIPTADVSPIALAPDHATQIADRDDLMGRLMRLPGRQRAAVVLRYYGGLTDLEVADTLGCSPGTARGYLSRALATMRVQLDSDTSLVSKDI
jgi:RNA polymerase sigma factor (sigma-70 family)